MTAVELYNLLNAEGPSWARSFTPAQILNGIGKAREVLKLEAYVQIPQAMLPAVVSQTAVYLNHVDPKLMQECFDKDYGGKGKEA